MLCKHQFHPTKSFIFTSHSNVVTKPLINNQLIIFMPSQNPISQSVVLSASYTSELSKGFLKLPMSPNVQSGLFRRDYLIQSLGPKHPQFFKAPR